MDDVLVDSQGHVTCVDGRWEGGHMYSEPISTAHLKQQRPQDYSSKTIVQEKLG